MRKSIVLAALAISVGVTIGSMHAQAPERSGQVLPPSVSKRGERQIGSSALNLLGLRVGFSAGAFGPISLSEAAAKADALGTGFLEASSSQKVSPEIPKSLDDNLSAEEVTAVKNRLAELRLRLVAYRAGAIPADESSRRRLFAFAKAVDIETIVTSAEPAALPDLDELAGEYGVNVAVEGANPKNLVSSLDGLSSRIGLSVDTAAWARAGIKPTDGLKLVNDRLLSLHLRDDGAAIEQLLLELAKLNPALPPPPVTCGDCAGPRVPVRPLFVTIDASGAAAEAFEKAARPAEGFQVVQISKMTPISDGRPGSPSAGSPKIAREQIDSTAIQRTNIRTDDRTILMGTDAVRRGGIKPIDLGPGKIGWIESWSSNNESLTWTAYVTTAGKYKVSAILESTGEDCAVEVSVDSKRLDAPCGERKWNRVTLGAVQLAIGSRTILFRSTGSRPLGKFFSLELVTPRAEANLARLSQQQASSTDWMVAAKYGLMFHWTSETKPRSGVPKPYCEAVRDFDVDRFADMVSQMGAGFVVFTTSHAGFYFPGPNQVIDAILPGRTCPRDLVGDLAKALRRYNIKLELYFHPGHDDNEWWQRTHFNENKTAYFDLWCKTISQTGRQYGDLLAGFWFDDAAFTYYPFNAPWQKMTAAAKTGDANRVITYNSWILPKLNDFYEVFAGENTFSTEMITGDNYLPIGGTGRFTGGPQQGLQGEITAIINGDWGHFKTDAPIDPPQFSTDVMVEKIKESMRRRNVPLLDVEVYQDGTISPETFQMFQTILRLIS